MSVKITGEFMGDLAVKMKHEPSGVTLITDPPVDNGGKGMGFSPTDLVGTALGACMMTMMAFLAKRDSLDLRGMRVSITKEMSSSAPRRISVLDVILTLPKHLSEEARSKLERGARTCPVFESLHPDVKINTLINYE